MPNDPMQPDLQPSAATIRMAEILGMKWMPKPTWWSAVIRHGDDVTICGGPGEMPKDIADAMLAEKERPHAQ